MRRSVRNGWVALLGLGAAVLAGCVAKPRLLGPLPVRNQHPAQLTVMHMPPASATVLERGAVQTRFDAAYSSLFLRSVTLGRSFVMDGEYLRFGPRLRAGLGADLELGLELPFAHASGGFLDGFLIDYHDVLGLPDQDRGSVPNDEFRIQAVANGQTVWAVEPNGVELADVPLMLTWQLSPPAAPVGVAVRGGVELPTGRDERGYGNGELDYSAGLLLDYQAEGVGLYGHAQYTLAGTPDQTRRAGLDFADVFSTGLAVELPLHENLHAFAQAEFETSTLRDFGLRATEREQLLLWIGGRLHLGERYGLEVGFGEDLRGFVSPDFTAWLAFTAQLF